MQQQDLYSTPFAIDSERNDVETKSMEFLEIETKYDADGIDLFAFKQIMEDTGLKDTLFYIESDDIYFYKEEEFLRYRYASSNKKSELTYKKKHSENNNVIRTEINIPIMGKPMEAIKEFSNMLGFTKTFFIQKFCSIYKSPDAILVHYSVKDSTKAVRHFIEIEVIEGLPKTEAEAFEILNKWEKVLEPLGIKSQKRLKKSLFEMYKEKP